MTTKEKIQEYIKTWKLRGYFDDIPDERPNEISHIVPSYKSIAICLLKNDLQLHGLGFSKTESQYYGILKQIEIKSRKEALNGKENNQEKNDQDN